jgi:hypothetical protein
LIKNQDFRPGGSPLPPLAKMSPVSFLQAKIDGFCVILFFARIKADTLTGIRRETEETGLRNS